MSERNTPESAVRAQNRHKELRRQERMVPDIDESQIIDEREQYRFDLRGFLLSCMPESFPKPFAECHDEMIEDLQECILNGGLQVTAVPRGTGKTTIARGATVWGILYGHIPYAPIIANDQTAADKLLSGIKIELWMNEHIGRLWPLLREYLSRGENDGNKFRHILNADGSPPLIKWGTTEIRLPFVDGHSWSGAIVQSKGITSGVRGMQSVTADGRTIRPQFVLIDDPSNKESARSETQNDLREEIIDGDILGLAGPDQELSAFMACTPIEPNDVAERYLSKDKHPKWRKIRTPMIISFPKEVDGLWEEYRMIYLEALKAEKDTSEATAFYEANRDAMDEGAEVYWEHRKLDKDLSPLQHAMNLRIERGNAFLTEYQTETLARSTGRPYQIDEIQVMSRTNGMDRCVVPDECVLLVCMTDINYSGLNTVVVASTNDAVRYIVDYQTYPGGGEDLYSRDRKKNKTEHSDLLAIAKALDTHIPFMGSERYYRGGKAIAPDLVLIDCGNWMDLVFRWCRSNAARVKGTRLYPSRGRSDSKYRPTQLVGQPGDGWHIADWKNRGRVLVHNSDLWRMRTQQAFVVPNAVPGSVSLYGNKIGQHKRYADEICAEVLDEYIEITEQKNTFYKWSHKVGAKNDLLDATVGCFAGLSCLGANEHQLTEIVGVKRQPRNRRRGRKVTKLKV